MNVQSQVSLAVAGVVVLLAGLVSLGFDKRGPVPGRRHEPRVFELLDGYTPAGWQKQSLKLSETELGREMVEKILQYDRVAYLHFKSATREFSVYVVYWEAGKVDIRAVNAHTPDTCWVNSGWTARFAQARFTGAGPVPEYLPGEYRCYENGGSVQYVAFWHLLGGRAVPMWRNGFPMPRFMWELFTRDRRRLGAEQYFIRVSSPAPLGELWSEPVFQEVMNLVATTGLRHDANPDNPR